MTPAQEKAEAFLIVIKRLAKWAAIGIGGVIVLVFIVGWTIDKSDKAERERRNAEEAKVDVYAYVPPNGECNKEYPYAFIVTNNGDKTVSNVRFYISIRRKGFSSDINGLTSMDADRILKKGEGYRWCFNADKKDYSGKLTETDVEFRVASKSVTYAD